MALDCLGSRVGDTNNCQNPSAANEREDHFHSISAGLSEREGDVTDVDVGVVVVKKKKNDPVVVVETSYNHTLNQTASHEVVAVVSVADEGFSSRFDAVADKQRDEQEEASREVHSPVEAGMYHGKCVFDRKGHRGRERERIVEGESCGHRRERKDVDLVLDHASSDVGVVDVVVVESGKGRTSVKVHHDLPLCLHTWYSGGAYHRTCCGREQVVGPSTAVSDEQRVEEGPVSSLTREEERHRCCEGDYYNPYCSVRSDCESVSVLDCDRDRDHEHVRGCDCGCDCDCVSRTVVGREKVRLSLA